MKTLSLQATTHQQRLRAGLLMLPLAASLCWLGTTPPAQAQPVQYIEQGQTRASFNQQELDRMLAPIALYPDALLTQILMAATYPLEVVQAARWSRARPGLAGDEAVRAANSQDWDPSVKSLVAFPQILAMMDEHLEWTQDLGDAFLDQEPHVMETVQMLRQRAYAAGNLQSDGQVRVVRQDRYILVEPAQPQVIYVPYYDPQVIYGAWWWPAPPVYWRPWAGYAPLHARPGVHVGFYFGSGVRIAADFFFGRPDWHRRSINVVHVNNYYYNRTVVVNRGGPPARVLAAPGPWRHDPVHRHSAPYRTPQARQQFAVQQRQAVEQREQRREEARREQRVAERRGPDRRDGDDRRRPERSAAAPSAAAAAPVQAAMPQRQEARTSEPAAVNRTQQRDARQAGRESRNEANDRNANGRDTGARSDAAQRAAEAQVQRQRQEQAQRQQQELAQRQQAERQQQAQRQAQEQAQRQQQQQAERQQRQQMQQARNEERQQQREARHDDKPRPTTNPGGGQRGREGRGEGRNEGRGEKRG